MSWKTNSFRDFKYLEISVDFSVGGWEIAWREYSCILALLLYSTLASAVSILSLVGARWTFGCTLNKLMKECLSHFPSSWRSSVTGTLCWCRLTVMAFQLLKLTVCGCDIFFFFLTRAC